MAWWDHEELKSPADRSDRYKIAFPDEYQEREVTSAKLRVMLVKTAEEKIKELKENDEHERKIRKSIERL